MYSDHNNAAAGAVGFKASVFPTRRTAVYRKFYAECGADELVEVKTSCYESSCVTKSDLC
jgi:hypothetical protein